MLGGVGFLAFVFLSLNLFPFTTKQPSSNLDYLTFNKPELWITKQGAKVKELDNLVPSDFLQEWLRFLSTEKKNMYIFFDRITGKPSLISGEGIPWIPGWVNDIKGSDLGLPDGIGGKDVPLSIVSQKAIGLINKYPKLFSIDPNFLKVNHIASGPISDYLYNVRFDFYYLDIPVERAHLSFHLNNGNLVQFGQEFICDSIYEIDPNPKISIGDAWDILWNYIGGKTEKDKILENEKLSIIPVSTDDVLKGNLVSPGNGLKYKLIYTISFIREGEIGTWEAKIDAHRGEILSFIDSNYYGHIQGGVCLHDNTSEVIMPFPAAKIVSGTDIFYSDSKGNFN